MQEKAEKQEKVYEVVMPNGVTYYGTMAKFCRTNDRKNYGEHTTMGHNRKIRRGSKWAW